MLAPDFTRVFGRPNVLSAVNVKSSIGESRGRHAHLQVPAAPPAHDLQAHYTLAGAYAYGGSIAARGGHGGRRRTRSIRWRTGEWGPTRQDERHRVVATGVFELPYGIQLSPVFQAASARPYNLTAGSDLNRMGPTKRSLDRSGDRPAGLDQCGTGRPDGRPGPAGDEVLPAGGRAADRRVCRDLQRAQQRQLRRGFHRQRPERAVRSAHRGVHPGDRVPTPAAAGRPVPLLTRISPI